MNANRLPMNGSQYGTTGTDFCPSDHISIELNPRPVHILVVITMIDAVVRLPITKREGSAIHLAMISNNIPG